VLYAAQGKTAVTCPTTTCGLHWNVERSREILRQALDDKLVTAGEAARLGQYLDTDRTQEQIRKLINRWASRGELVAHPVGLDEEAFRFGEVAGRLARTPRRTTRGVAA
jgi:chromosome condensin MukBEF MukE localization factor